MWFQAQAAIHPPCPTPSSDHHREPCFPSPPPTIGRSRKTRFSKVARCFDSGFPALAANVRVSCQKRKIIFWISTKKEEDSFLLKGFPSFLLSVFPFACVCSWRLNYLGISRNQEPGIRWVKIKSLPPFFLSGCWGSTFNPFCPIYYPISKAKQTCTSPQSPQLLKSTIAVFVAPSSVMF
jgi:hypothetical protein